MSAFDILLSFLEGIALIASPCILPVLPLILSTGIDGGKARPFGIVTGFVVSFSAFVLLSRQLIEALHISPDAIRNFSLVLLTFLGLILLSGKLSAWFSRVTQGAADFGGKFGAHQGGYGSGVLIGALIGLVWTPCAGPILAAVLVQVIRQQTDLQSVLVTLGFALGAGIPMLVIALLGRKVMSRVGFLTQHTETIRKIFALLILASVGWLAFGGALGQAISLSPQMERAAGGNVMGLEQPLDHPYPAPAFTGIQQWLNSPPLTMQQLRGKVVLVDFWTYSCINCVRTLPYLTGWDAKYRDKGLVIIGIHAPEFEFEKNIDNINAALTQHGIKYPVAVDNNLDSWGAFANKYWPAHYLIDRNGNVVYTHFGEGDYDITENNIRYLLGLTGKVDIDNPTVHGDNQTPETYLGYARAERFTGKRHHGDTIYDLKNPAQDEWSLGGDWKIQPQKIIAGQGAELRLHFTAKRVFLVLGTADNKPKHIALSLNGLPLGDNAGKDTQDNGLTVTGHNLYELVNQPTAQEGRLAIKFAPGVEAYAFTFGN